MKFAGGSVIAPLFIPFLGVSYNGTHSSNEVVPTGTASFSSIYPTPSHHHRSHEHDNTRTGQQTHLRLGLSSDLQPSVDCPSTPVKSCSAQADSTNACCVVRPGGILVHAQFWDLNEGVADSWGIHGLWPDKCDNSYYENCDSSRAYSGDQIRDAIQSAGQTSLLDYMNRYWVSNDESAPDFWSHEWETHGTCVSTIEPSCFENYQTAQEVVPYFETVVSLFQKLDTYRALANAGITPSDSATYKLTDLKGAVKDHLGYTPDFMCDGDTLSTVQYYMNVNGPLQNGDFVESSPSRSSDCPADGVKYPVKQLGDQGRSSFVRGDR